MGYGREIALELEASEVRNLALVLADFDPERMPLNLWAPVYTEANRLESAWVYNDRGLAWQLSPISAADNAVYLNTAEDGLYSLTGLDWDTGKVIATITLGKSVMFNTGGTFVTPLPDGGLYINGFFGPVRIAAPAKQVAANSYSAVTLLTLERAARALERSRNLVFRAARQWRLRLPRTCLYRAVFARETVDSLRIQPRGLEFETASSIGGRLRKMPDRRAPGPWA
jgi:hypothetical protein